MRAINMVSLLLLSTISAVPAVASAERFWTSVGAGCVPVDEDVVLDNYDSRGFGVGFKGTATGSIRMICPVTFRATGADPYINGIYMSYKDPDGTGTQSRIRADFRQVSDSSNASSSLCVVDSNGYPDTGNNTEGCSFFPGFNPATNKSYYVEVTIERTTSTRDPELLSVFVQ